MILFVKYVFQDLNEHYNIHHTKVRHDLLKTNRDLKKNSIDKSIVPLVFITYYYVRNHGILYQMFLQLWAC